MRFLHRIVHRDAYHVIVHTIASAGQHPVSLPEVKCPGCGTWYFADVESSDDAPWGVGAGVYEARRRLFVECPDHAHAFTVE